MALPKNDKLDIYIIVENKILYFLPHNNILPQNNIMLSMTLDLDYLSSI